MKKLIIFIVIVLLIGLGISKCTHSSQDNQNDPANLIHYTVKLTALDKPVYFSGTIAPLTTKNVISPVDGIVESQSFAYGQDVIKDQVLFTIISDKLQQDFQDALSGYLKALDDYRDKERKYEASTNLRKLKFISDDDFYSDKNSRDESYMGLLQAQYKMFSILKELGLNTDFGQYQKMGRERIVQALLKYWGKIQIKAPVAGLALFPLKTDTTSKEIQTAVPGSEVKTGQVLLSIGDLSGLTVPISITEIDIFQIKPGLKVKVSGPAFPDQMLEGSIESVNSQAITDSSSLPMFSATVTIKNITPEQRKVVHIGMTAKVEVDLHAEKVIVVPLEAVYEKNDKVVVDVLDPKTDNVTATTISTGTTTLDNVVVTKGLKPGDVIVYRHTAE